MRELGNKPVKVMCLNCHRQIDAWRDENGCTKSKCPICGTVTVSKVMSRRHVQFDVFAPLGQELLS